MPIVQPRKTLSSMARNFSRVALPITLSFVGVGIMCFAIQRDVQEQRKQKQVEQDRAEQLSQIRARAEQRMAERREQEAKQVTEKEAQAVKDTEQRLLDAFNRGSKKVVLADGGIYALMSAEDIDGKRIISAHKIIGTSEDSNAIIIDQTPVVRVSVPKPE